MSAGVASRVVTLLASLALLVGVGCAGFEGGAGDRPEGFRLVQGTLLVPEEDLLGRQVTGLQIAAIAIGTEGASDDIDVFGSAVFDASRVETARFVAPVDGERAFVLVLQVPSASARGPGAFLGVLTFNDSGAERTLIPPGLDDFDLGPVSVVAGAARPVGNTLKVGDATSPLAQIDTDDDGAVDQADLDDDEDGTPDASDTDTGDDGVDDALQTLDALPDEDDDGIADLLAS